MQFRLQMLCKHSEGVTEKLAQSVHGVIQGFPGVTIAKNAILTDKLTVHAHAIVPFPNFEETNANRGPTYHQLPPVL